MADAKKPRNTGQKRRKSGKSEPATAAEIADAKEQLAEQHEGEAARMLLREAAALRGKMPCLHGTLTLRLVYVDGWLDRVTVTPEFSHKVAREIKRPAE